MRLNSETTPTSISALSFLHFTRQHFEAIRSLEEHANPRYGSDDFTRSQQTLTMCDITLQKHSTASPALVGALKIVCLPWHQRPFLSLKLKTQQRVSSPRLSYQEPGRTIRCPKMYSNLNATTKIAVSASRHTSVTKKSKILPQWSR